AGHTPVSSRGPGARQVGAADARAAVSERLLRHLRARLRAQRARADRRQALAARQILRRGPAPALRLPRGTRSPAPGASHGPGGAPAPAVGPDEAPDLL